MSGLGGPHENPYERDELRHTETESGPVAPPATAREVPPSGGTRVDDALGVESDTATEATELAQEAADIPPAAVASNPLIWRGMWHVPEFSGERFWRAWSLRVGLLMLGVLVLSVAFVTAYVGGLHKPAPKDIPVAVVRDDTAAMALLAGIRSNGNALLPVVVASAAEADDKLARRDVFAVVSSDASGDMPGVSLTTASASGPAVANAVVVAVGAATDAVGIPLAVTDGYPVAPNDPRGLVPFYLVVGLILGGFLVATVLGLGLGTVPRDVDRAGMRLGALAVFSVVLAFAAALVVGPGYGIWNRHTVGLAIGGALIVFTAAVITSALQAWFGMVGTGVAMLVLVILGNPGSGGVFPWPFLPDFFRGMHNWIPTGLGTELVSAIAYFNRKASGAPITGLALWSLLGLVGLVAATAVLGRRAARAL